MKHVVIGGGVAGVTCVQELHRLRSGQSDTITLISASPVIKLANNVVQITQTLEHFDIVEQSLQSLNEESKDGIQVVHAKVSRIDAAARLVHCDNDKTYPYDRLCIASGGRPNLVLDSPHVVGIRDTDSVETLSARLASSRRLLVVGNGGIALQLVHSLTQQRMGRKCELVWVMKDRFLGNTFLDRASSAFLMPSLFPDGDPQHLLDAFAASAPSGPALPGSVGSEPVAATGLKAGVMLAAKPRAFTMEPGARNESKSLRGAALGPLWAEHLKIAPAGTGETATEPPVTDAGSDSCSDTGLALRIEFGCDIKSARELGPEASWPLEVELSNGRLYQCDLLISATGVVPNTEFLGPEFKRGPDGGVVIDDRMRTSVEGVVAAGDAAYADFAGSDPDSHWFQMRLWTQARTMGTYAARAMSGMDDELGFFFELFAHTTRVFGHKLVLLGRYNGQGLGEEGRDFRVLMRVKPPDEAASSGEDGSGTFVKFILRDHKLVGATLIGETDLEETCEHLILDRLDLSRYGDDLLSEDIDLEDYFD